jgi:iron(III) transport system ATP-binding protein
VSLVIENIFHAYDGVPVVGGVSCRIEAGEVACLLGPSGCGKTTVLRLAAGLETLQRGRIRIGERVVADGQRGISLPPEARHVGLMFQDYALFPHLSVLDNIAFSVTTRRRQAWIRSALERVGLADAAHSYPHTLSGGQQQRCALLRALAPEPAVLLLDEPFSGLDTTRREQVREQTLALLRETGVATLIVTHDPEEAMFMADRLFIMADGGIVQQGRPQDIYLAPVDPFVATLFGPVNRFQGTVVGGEVQTPVGTVEANGAADGQRVEVIIRPEFIVLAPRPGGGVPAQVDAARLLGRSSHLRLLIEGAAAPVQALVPGIYLPKSGERIEVAADRRHVFVFAGR